MSYCHMFYGLNLEKLRSLYGSKDNGFASEVLAARAQDIKDNDEFFEEEIEDGNFPDSKKALREIIAGVITPSQGAEGMFGYVLKILCEHIGERIGKDVACVEDHRFASQLVASGPPIPIPYDK